MQIQKLKHLAAVVIVSIGLAAQASAANYKIDSDHSRIGFKVRHLGISAVPGKFTQFSGSFNYDPTNLAASSAHAEVEVKSVDTEQQKRDDHLRSPDFFDAAKFGKMTFKSTKVEPVNSESFKLHGDLTIHGITKPVTFDVNVGGTAKDPWGNERAGFAAEAKINRKDFGLAWSKTLDNGSLVVGDEVMIDLEIEGIKEKA